MAAKRTVKTAPVVALNPISPLDVFSALIEFDSTEDNHTSVADLEMELAETVTDLLPVLDSLEDAGLIKMDGRGDKVTAWLVVDATEANAAELIAEAFDKTESKSKSRERLEYATRLAESQDGVMSQSPVVQAAVTPAEDTQTGLTREQVKAELPSVVLVTSKPFDLNVYIETVKVQRDHASQDRASWTELDDVDLPTLPAGVHENTWYHVFNSQGVTEKDTYSARLFWAEYVAKQIAA